MSDAQIARLIAKGFAETHITDLCGDVLAWRKRTTLPAECKMQQLASICIPYCSEDDQYQEAERLVIHTALVHAAKAPGSPSTTPNN